MYTRAETFFKGYDKTKLFLQTWQKKEAQATILITHGQAEHSECYLRLINGLEKHLELNFVAWDLRGHGKSDGLRGYASDFNDYILDYEIFLEQALSLPFVKNKPVFVLGHSMGGLIQTRYLGQKKRSDFVAQILSSPFFGLSMPVPVWKESAAGLINQFIPKLTLGNEIKYELLTRDLDVIREYEKDTYRHAKISTGVFMGIKRTFEEMQSQPLQIDLPTYMSISDHDPVVSTPAALNFFETLSSNEKILKLVDGAKHELYNDTCREEVFKSISEFCLPYINK